MVGTEMMVGGGDDGEDGGETPPVPEIPGQTLITPQGRFILSRRDGRDVPIPVDEYRREMIQRVLSEAHDLDEFRQLWIESQKRRKLIDHLLGDNFSPELIREIDQMTDYDTLRSFCPPRLSRPRPQAPGAQVRLPEGQPRLV